MILVVLVLAFLLVLVLVALAMANLSKGKGKAIPIYVDENGKDNIMPYNDEGMLVRPINPIKTVTSPGKIIKNGLNVFERGENLLQNGILQFVFRVSQSIVRNRAFTQTKNEKKTKN